MIPIEIEQPLVTKLESMKNKQWIYNDMVVEVLGFLVGSGDKGTDVEIYITGQTIYTDYLRARRLLDTFHPIHEQARALQVAENRKLTVCSSDTVGELRQTLLDQIRKLRDNPNKETLAQSKAINDTINQFTNLARTELEYKKFLQNPK